MDANPLIFPLTTGAISRVYSPSPTGSCQDDDEGPSKQNAMPPPSQLPPQSGHAATQPRARKGGKNQPGYDGDQLVEGVESLDLRIHPGRDKRWKSSIHGGFYHRLDDF